MTRATFHEISSDLPRFLFRQDLAPVWWTGPLFWRQRGDSSWRPPCFAMLSLASTWVPSCRMGKIPWILVDPQVPYVYPYLFLSEVCKLRANSPVSRNPLRQRLRDEKHIRSKNTLTKPSLMRIRSCDVLWQELCKELNSMDFSEGSPKAGIQVMNMFQLQTLGAFDHPMLLSPLDLTVLFPCQCRAKYQCHAAEHDQSLYIF